MTSKSLFWTNSIENHRRRIWVWAIAILAQLVLYPGAMTVYLARMRTYEQRGMFTGQAFQLNLYAAAADALGFKIQLPWAVLFLAALIGIQGFSYLYSRKKVDMYHSVPVSSKLRFFVIYVNGIVIYITTYLTGVLLAIVIAAINSALDKRALIECGLASLINVLYFLAAYNAVVLSMMLCGKILAAIGLSGVFLHMGGVIELLLDGLRLEFYETADTVFSHSGMRFSIAADYIESVYTYKYETQLSAIVEKVLPLCLKYFAAAIIFGAAAYFFYRKRKSEAAGSMIAFPCVKPLLKIILSAVFGIGVGQFIKGNVFTELGRGDAVIICCCIGAAAFLCSMAAEAVYELDICAVIKGMASTVISAVIAVAVFGIYCFDVFGYDAYVPDPDKVESAAVLLFYEQNYFEPGETDKSTSYVSESEYLRENMFLKDIEAICRLVEKNGSVNIGENDTRYINVLFRLKSGREVSRRYAVDFKDPAAEGMLNRIMGTREYREGCYQLAKAGDGLTKGGFVASYTNGTVLTKLRSDAESMRKAWMKDMESFDYTLMRNNMPCGYLEIGMPAAYARWHLPVYGSFKNTIACLEKEGVNTSAVVRTEDVAIIMVRNRNYDKQENNSEVISETVAADAPAGTTYYPGEYDMQVRKVYGAPEQIAQIAAALYPEELAVYRWFDDEFEDSYEVYITYKTDTEYYYEPVQYCYRFLKGQAPEFVKKDTAYSGE